MTHLGRVHHGYLYILIEVEALYLEDVLNKKLINLKTY